MKEIRFGTDGWRGIIADDFTFDNVEIVSRAIGKFILKRHEPSLPILIGHDPRFLADKFALACANKLANLRLNIQITSSVTPTPVLAYNASANKTNGAIQFTASHNPPKYLGIKYITNYGGPAPEEVTDEITKYISSQQSALSNQQSAVSSQIQTFDPKSKYFSHLKKLIDFNLIRNAGLKIVYDPLYGAGNNYLDCILKEAGCEVITIHNKKDPLFGGLLPEPKEESLDDLKKAIHLNKADLGIATDGDADRISAIDQDGTFFSPNEIASMLLRHLYKNKKLKGKVVRTISTTHMLDHLAKKYNLELVETKVGFKWIAQEMINSTVLLGAEESGGFSILNHIPDKDAILTGLLLCEMIAYEKKPLKEIYKETINETGWYCVNDRLDLHMNEAQKNDLISKLQSETLKEINGLKVKSINKIEGAKYIFEDGSWFLARASGTEPMARVYFEATSDKVLGEIKKTIQELITI